MATPPSRGGFPLVYNEGVSVLVLFLDGVGLGDPNPAINPFAKAGTPTLRRLLGGPMVAQKTGSRPGVMLLSADATLGIAGMPQSATGQTALLTGVNAPAFAGRHVSAYPTADLRELLSAESIFAQARRRGLRVALANAYSPEYFSAVALRRLRVAAVTHAAQAAGVRLRSVDDLRAGRAVFHDLVNHRLRGWGHDVQPLTPRLAGHRLGAIASGQDLTFFEFFLTDLAAHGRTALSPEAVIGMTDDLLAGVLERLDTGTTLLVTSDHGNIEDGRTSNHTRCPVPVLAVGPRREAFRGVRRITDIAPAILSALGGRLGGSVTPGAVLNGGVTG